MNNVQEQCPQVTWCTEGTRLHTKHQQTVLTLLGESVNGQPHGVSCQLVVFGASEYIPRLAIVLVDSSGLRQSDVELSWHQATQLASQIELAAGRFREGR